MSLERPAKSSAIICISGGFCILLLFLYTALASSCMSCLGGNFIKIGNIGIHFRDAFLNDLMHFVLMSITVVAEVCSRWNQGVKGIVRPPPPPTVKFPGVFAKKTHIIFIWHVYLPNLCAIREPNYFILHIHYLILHMTTQGGGIAQKMILLFQQFSYQCNMDFRGP